MGAVTSYHMFGILSPKVPTKSCHVLPVLFKPLPSLSLSVCW